jgi:hypothetical protein
VLPTSGPVRLVGQGGAQVPPGEHRAHTPRLVIRAPEKRCGKSRLLDVAEGTCHEPLITVNATPAVASRAIGQPTAATAEAGVPGYVQLRRSAATDRTSPERSIWARTSSTVSGRCFLEFTICCKQPQTIFSLMSIRSSM